MRNTAPGTPSGAAVATSRDYQLTIIGGFTDGFHFYPVIVRDNVATIYPHHNLLQYNKTYYVQMDPGVLSLADGSFQGINGNTSWTFTTKRTPPPQVTARVVVACRWYWRLQYRAGRDRLRSRSKSAPNDDLHYSQRHYEEIVYFATSPA
jgi:hypothetical protein